MKIAMFGHKRIPSREGGVEVVVEQLAVRMAAQGHDVTCYNRGGHHVSGAEFDTSDDCPSVRLRTVPTLDKKGLAAVTSSFFAALCAAFGRYDAVHIHAEGPAFMSFLPKLLGKRVIVTVHGLNWQCDKWQKSFAAKYIYMGEKMAVRFADEIIVLSKSTQQYFMDAYGRETKYIPNGVNRPEIVEAAEITEKFGLTKGGYFLSLGRLVPEKGIHYLIEAFRGLRTDKKLVIAGGSSDTDEYVAQLKAMAAEDDRILFTGFVQGQLLEELYSNCYVFVLPSNVEGMPLSLLEAMSYGNCCVVSDIPQCTEPAENKVLTFPKGDVKVLRETLQHLCDSPEETTKYKTGVRDFICEKYNWDEVVQQTLELYQ